MDDFERVKSNWDRLAIPVILMVIGALAAWVLNINADIEVLKRTQRTVDSMIVEQRNVERMVSVLESQLKTQNELANEMKTSQKELSKAVTELREAMAGLMATRANER